MLNVGNQPSTQFVWNAAVRDAAGFMSCANVGGSQMNLINKSEVPEFVRIGTLFEAADEVLKEYNAECERRVDAMERRDWDACEEHRIRSNAIFKTHSIIMKLAERRGALQ